ncbi:DUF2167 domain-containing protein [Myxococcota bacterium]|nr:DUF2167 domain-containing protein [Myxococcota bacterium]
MMLRPARILLSSLVLGSAAITTAALAQQPPPVAQDAPGEQAGGQAAPAEDPLAKFPWQREGVARLGSNAQLNIPKGFQFIPGNEASKLIELMGNISGKDEVGLIGTENLDWFVVFFFEDVGYVKDDEKDELDANEMAEQMRENLVGSNEVRRERGLEELTFDGWAIPPRFNDQTKELEWAQRLKSVSGVSVNYNTRVLGRRGVMRVILVTDPDLLDQTLPAYRELMTGFTFTQGEDYASYRPGDKVAEYGLIALVAGGAGAVAAKAGLFTIIATFFKKGAKLIAIAVAGLFAAVSKLFGKKKEG